MSEATMPKTEDKTPCEVCGEMVTTHKGGRASHMRKHKEVESKPVAETVANVATGATADERAIIASAIAAEENFRKAPDVFLSEDTSDGNASLVRMYAPDCLDKFNSEGKLVAKAARKPFFSSRENLARWASRGYKPVAGVNGALVTNDGGDVLTSCDRRISEARELRAQKESRAIVRSSATDLGSVKKGDAEGADGSDLRNASVKVTQEEIEV
jgi:hypothetical protein